MPAISASPLTPFDYIAEGYWQDFLAGRPIAGGMAYEVELHHCQLDESLASLQRVDTLLTQIRHDMIKAGSWAEKKIVADERYRNFLVFLAFYAGRVLANQWQKPAHWYGEFELRARYPKLPLISDDFYQHMAALYDDGFIFTDNTKSNRNEGNNNNYKSSAAVFFALEPIGLRLFGHIDRQFAAVQGGQVASGLYQAVSARLPGVTTEHTPTVSALNATLSSSLSPSSTMGLKDVQSVTFTKTTEPMLNHQAVDTLKRVISPTATMSTATVLDAVTEARSAADETQDKPLLTQNLSSSVSKTIAPRKVPPTPDVFTQLLTELNEIEVVQNAGNEDYQQACKTLDQFERHIAKQHKPRAQVIFSESHQNAKQHALTGLQNAADLGNTAAMLRLAMYELLGERLSVDNAAGDTAGVDRIKRAASVKDVRAQRLLSSMYYQGIGVPQDINNGKYWLEQAAENGHLEAADLVGQWQQAQALITTRQQEQHSIKRYQLLIGVVIVAALLLLIFV